MDARFGDGPGLWDNRPHDGRGRAGFGVRVGGPAAMTGPEGYGFSDLTGAETGGFGLSCSGLSGVTGGFGFSCTWIGVSGGIGGFGLSWTWIGLSGVAGGLGLS